MTRNIVEIPLDGSADPQPGGDRPAGTFGGVVAARQGVRVRHGSQRRRRDLDPQCGDRAGTAGGHTGQFSTGRQRVSDHAGLLAGRGADRIRPPQPLQPEKSRRHGDLDRTGNRRSACPTRRCKGRAVGAHLVAGRQLDRVHVTRAAVGRHEGPGGRERTRRDAVDARSLGSAVRGGVVSQRRLDRDPCQGRNDSGQPGWKAEARAAQSGVLRSGLVSRRRHCCTVWTGAIRSSGLSR